MALMGLSLSWVLLLLASSISACPQNLGSCRCNPSPIPRMKPVLDCSEVSDHNDFLKIEGLHSAQPGGRPVFSQIVIRRSEIQEIPPGAFGIAEADEYIIENNPQLEKIERAGLGFHANPKVISIKNNPLLEVIQFEGYSSLRDLEVLRLNDNRLQEVADFAFDGMSPKLREINLERNVILDIGSFPFRNLPGLKTLLLAENQIGDLGTSSLFFSAPPDLVDLSRNRIVTVDNDAFSDATSRGANGAYAKHINLSNNRISNLNMRSWQSIFNRMDALEKIANPTPPPPPPTAAPVPTSPAPPPAAAAAAAPAAPVSASSGAAAEIPAAGPPAASSVADPVQPPAQERGIQTENLLLKILERLQALTLPAQSASAPSIGVTAAALNPENPLHRILRKRAIGPLTTIAEAAKGHHVVAKSPGDMFDAFQPFFERKEDVMDAIRANPEAAVAAAKAVSVAAEAAAASAAAVENAAAGAAAAVETAVLAAVAMQQRQPVEAAGNENVVNPVVEELQAAIPDQVPEQVASAIPSGAVEANEQLSQAALDVAQAPEQAAAALAPAVIEQVSSLSPVEPATSVVEQVSEAAAPLIEQAADVAAVGTEAVVASVRAKRQVEPASASAAGPEPPVVPARIYTIDFSGNQLDCGCGSKWISDSRYKYEDQLQNLSCRNGQMSLFQLDIGHWRRQSC